MEQAMERRQRNIAAAQKAEASGRWLSQWLPRSPLEAASLAAELSPEGNLPRPLRCLTLLAAA
jgi:hypothetical protein